ncbi:hypothetical protein ACLOJK_009940 [Asimina triloba]
MYAEAGIRFPFMQQAFRHESQHSLLLPKSTAMENPIHTSTLLEYDPGVGDLFKTPECVIEESALVFDTMPTSISMISGCEDVISPDAVKVTDIKSTQSRQHLNETSLVPNSTALDYDLGGGDLFRAPETIIEEPGLRFDAMTATMPMISGCEDVISTQGIKVADIESIEREHQLNEVFYECKKDLLAKSAINDTFSEVSDIKIPTMQMDYLTIDRDKSIFAGAIQKSISSDSLSSIPRPSFLDFQTMDLGVAFRMRRSFSEGDLRRIGNGERNTLPVHSEKMLAIGNYAVEDRQYLRASMHLTMANSPSMDRAKYVFSRSLILIIADGYSRERLEFTFFRPVNAATRFLMYTCRKALADSQPRFRGRFAKMGEGDPSSHLK